MGLRLDLISILDRARLRDRGSHHYLLIAIRSGWLLGLAQLPGHRLSRGELGFGTSVTLRCLMRVELSGVWCRLPEKHAIVELHALQL